ncbi:MAG: rhomboid family intramembrane serine protease [Polyangiaceae bacterium]
MFFPIGHEDLRTRRLPVVTLALIVACVLVHFAIAALGPGDGPALGAAAAVDQFLDDHPGLEPPDDCRAALKLVQKPWAMTDPSRTKPKAAGTSHDDGAEDDARDELAALCTKYTDAVDDLPLHRFGYVPARPRVLSLVTSLFLHGDVFHLLGNMWFLFLVGMNLEDRWGRPIFATFYFASGVFATLVQSLVSHGSTLPIIGASGAIAGVMGAFAVVLPKTRIRIAYLFMSLRPRTFQAPAWVALVFWCLFEVVYGILDLEPGVANWAHVSGFVLGAGLAFGAKKSGYDRKLDREVDREATLGDDPRLETANLLTIRGKAVEAVAMLRGLAEEAPESEHVFEALLKAAKLAHDKDAMLLATKRLIDIHLDADRPKDAMAVYEDAKLSGVASLLAQTTVLKVMGANSRGL